MHMIVPFARALFRLERDTSIIADRLCEIYQENEYYLPDMAITQMKCQLEIDGQIFDNYFTRLSNRENFKKMLESDGRVLDNHITILPDTLSNREHFQKMLEITLKDRPASFSRLTAMKCAIIAKNGKYEFIGGIESRIYNHCGLVFSNFGTLNVRRRTLGTYLPEVDQKVAKMDRELISVSPK